MKKIIFSVLVFCLSTSVFAQTNTDSEPEFVRTISFDGFIKTRFETTTNLESNMMRFNVRHARVGVRSEINPYVSLRMMAELLQNGTLAIHDMFATIRPTTNLSIHLGQHLIPFDNTYIISPADQMFANVAFVGTYFSPGVRDIGVGAHYRFFGLGDLPMEIQGGLFNGGVVNRPEWSREPSYAFRLITGSMSGVRSTAKVYRFAGNERELLPGELLLPIANQRMILWGADFRYTNSRLTVETEIMHRHSQTYNSDLWGTYIQGLYTIPLSNGKIFHSFAPAFRWDAMGYNKTDGFDFDINRVTAGLQFGLMQGLPFHSLIRIDYEHFFYRKGVTKYNFRDFTAASRRNELNLFAESKFTVEWIVRF